MPLSLLDTNVLVHAAYQQSPLFADARRILDHALTQSAYCISPQNMVEFAAVVSKKRKVGAVLSAAEISQFLRVLYRSRILKKIYPKRATVIRAARDGTRLEISGPVWYDMYLALTMRDAAVSRIVTEDQTDYGKFTFVTAVGIKEEAGSIT